MGNVVNRMTNRTGQLQLNHANNDKSLGPPEIKITNENSTDLPQDDDDIELPGKIPFKGCCPVIALTIRQTIYLLADCLSPATGRCIHSCFLDVEAEMDCIGFQHPV